jgi:hypothetical protein
MIRKSRMVLAAPGPLLTPPPSSSPPKTPHRSYESSLGGLDPRMKRRTTLPKPYLPPQRRTRHRLSHRPHRQCRCGVIPLPQHVLHPTDHVQQETHPTDTPPQSARKNGAGEARRRGDVDEGEPQAQTATDRAEHAATPHQRQAPPSNKTHSTAHIFTNDPHRRKPAHSRRRASTGGRPRRAVTVRGRPPGDARRQPRVRTISGRPPVETRTASCAPARGRSPP